MARSLPIYTLSLAVALVAIACGSGDDSGLFGPGGAGAGHGGAGVGGDGGSGVGGDSGASGEGGAGGAGGAGGEDGSVGGGGVGGNGGQPGAGGTAGTGGDPGTGGTGGATGPCEYKAHDAWSLDDLATSINADISAGWTLHSLHARPENNSGGAQPNVVWLQNGGAFHALQDYSLAGLTNAVQADLASGSVVHTVLARSDMSSVPPEVAWLSKSGAYKAYDGWSLATVEGKVNADVGNGYEVVGLFAREENNSGSAKPNVVWLRDAKGFIALQDTNLATLAANVSSNVASGYSVHSILARPDMSSVPPEVAWLRSGNTFHAYSDWTLAGLATKINQDAAAGYTVEAIHARTENNSGSSKPNVAWLQQGSTFTALQDFNLDSLASAVNGQVAAGWTVHTIRARAHMSSVPPEVAWLKRGCP